MTYLEFKKKWLGKRVDVDKINDYQCVDLIKAYLLECFSIPNGSYGDAVDYWLTPNAAILKKFVKVIDAPKQGDIVILNQAMPYGHIGIIDSPTTYIEQNGGSGNGDGLGTNAIRSKKLSKNLIFGLLRPVANIVETTLPTQFGDKLLNLTHKAASSSATRYYNDFVNEVEKNKVLLSQKNKAEDQLSAMVKVVDKYVDELKTATFVS